MTKILSYSALFIFGTYWCMTLLFTAPDNYFKIQFYKADYLFKDLFFQQWSFFAPPPSFNDKLYYVLRNKEDKKITYSLEVLQPIYQKKQASIPFNQKETIMDYLLSNSVNSFKKAYSEHVNILKFNEPDSSDAYYRRVSTERITDLKNPSNEFQTLKNYAKLVAQKNGIDITSSEFKIILSQEAIPKFKDRKNPELVKEINPVLETKYMAF